MFLRNTEENNHPSQGYVQFQYPLKSSYNQNLSDDFRRCRLKYKISLKWTDSRGTDIWLEIYTKNLSLQGMIDLVSTQIF